MIKFFHIGLLLFTLAVQAYGQEKFLRLTYACKEQTTAFGAIKLIDNRNETQIIGIVQKGIANTPAEVKYAGSLGDSLAAFFKDTSISVSKPTLVLKINEFYLNERADNGYEIGNFRLSLHLFSGIQDNRFAELLSIDSTYSVEGMDVTNKLLKSVSDRFCLIASQASALQKKQDMNQPVYYSFQDLLSLDSLEKLKIPMYQADQAQVGIYKNYSQFKSNNPDKTGEIFIEENKGGTRVYVWDEQKKKKIKIDSKTIYAVSDGKSLLRGTFLGYHKIVKEKSDFYYWRPVLDNTTRSYPMYYYNPAGGVLAGAIAGALTAAIIAGTRNDKKWVLQKINYRRGNSVPVAWVERKPE